jgi:hypothetical protein
MTPKKTNEISPYDNAGVLSSLTFNYVRPLLRKGAKTPIVEEDLPPMATRDDVTFIVGKVERSWSRECISSKNSNKQPKLAKALFFAFKFDFLMGSFLSLSEVVLIITQV